MDHTCNRIKIKRNEKGLSFLKFKVALVQNAEPRFFQIDMIFAKSSSRTIALRQDHKIERLAIASKRNRQKRDRERERENHVASIPILYSPCSLSLAYMALQRRRRIFHEKKRFSRSPFVIYSYALITRFTPNPPPGHQLGWNGRSRKRAGMVGNRQSAAVISGWTKARG